MQLLHLSKISLILFVATLVACSQKKTTQNGVYFASPESGEIIKTGQSLSLRLNFSDANIDSVQYFVDSARIKTSLDTSVISISTDSFALGSRLITAKIFKKAELQEITSNIVLVSSKTPAQYGYKIIKSFPHSTTSYTEGLEYHNGLFYESAGDYGYSSLRKVALDGKVLQQQNIDKQYFAEGITIIGDKIIQLTYKEKVGFEYDKATFKLLKTFPYNHANEGWGLCFNGKTIYNTDGTNRIFKLNKNTYLPEGYLEVYDNKGPVAQLNELEWVDGKLYANIYGSELLAIINPQTGEVEAYINLIGLPHGPLVDEGNDVLNGIAYDAAGKRLFVTGKKWDKLFQIVIIKN